MMTDLEDLSALLAKEHSALYCLKPTAGLRFVESKDARFVPPRLSNVADVAGRRIVLFSASAAAGKSMLAEHLAWATGGLLLDLAQYNVGDNFIAGTLYKGFGDQVGSVLNDIASGRLTLVLDALDETQLRSGESNFEAFLRDVVNLVKNTSFQAPSSLVLLARAETAEFVGLILEDEDVPHVVARIEFFTQEQAREFIDLQLDHLRGNTSVHRSQREAFTKTRDVLWQLVERATARDGDVDQELAFLGYPPVLLALAEYLAVDNPYSLLQDLSSLDDDAQMLSEPWGLVARILERILEREHGKIVTAIRERLQPAVDDLGWDQWSEVYTAYEQCARVADWIFRRNTEEDFDLTMPTEARDEYHRLLETALPQHAFVGQSHVFANAVFEDYALARLLAEAQPHRRRDTRADLHARERLASPLLGHFLLLLTAGQLLDAADVGIVLESLMAQAVRPGDVSLQLEQAGSNDPIIAVFQTGRLTLRCQFSPTDSFIQFRRGLRNATINVHTPILIGLAASDALLGPGIDLTTSILSIPAAVIRVVCEADAPLILEAQEFEGNLGRTDLTVHGPPEALVVAWPSPTYPWAEYAREPRRQSVENAALEGRLRDLSHIFKYFIRQGLEGSLTAGRDLINNIAVGSSPGRQRVMRLLLESGIVHLSGKEYEASQSALAAASINYMDLRLRRMTPDLSNFLGQIIDE